MIKIRCIKHPRYAALREPSCDCKACWALWHMTRGKLDGVEVVRGGK